jgi:hypothetical protein
MRTAYRKVKLTYSDCTDCVETKSGTSKWFKVSNTVGQQVTSQQLCSMSSLMKLPMKLEEKTTDQT